MTVSLRRLAEYSLTNRTTTAGVTVTPGGGTVTRRDWQPDSECRGGFRPLAGGFRRRRAWYPARAGPDRGRHGNFKFTGDMATSSSLAGTTMTTGKFRVPPGLLA